MKLSLVIAYVCVCWRCLQVSVLVASFCLVASKQIVLTSEILVNFELEVFLFIFFVTPERLEGSLLPPPCQKCHLALFFRLSLGGGYNQLPLPHRWTGLISHSLILLLVGLVLLKNWTVASHLTLALPTGCHPSGLPKFCRDPMRYF